MKTASIEYRHATQPADRDRVRAIVESSGFFNREEIDVAVELVEERLAKGDNSGYFFVFAEMEGRTVGYACFGPIPGTQCSFDLYWIAVKADCRGTGIGKGLLQKAEESIRGMGGRRIYVETSSRKLYEPTRAFYRNQGYRMEAVLEDYYAPGDSRNTYVRVF